MQSAPGLLRQAESQGSLSMHYGLSRLSQKTFRTYARVHCVVFVQKRIKEAKKGEMVFQQVSQHLLVHGTWDSRIVI
jgi:hypothetical protein